MRWKFPIGPAKLVSHYGLRQSLCHDNQPHTSCLISQHAHTSTPLLNDTDSFHENDTNFGSLGLPSGPILFFANRCSVYILLASSKPTFLVFIIFCTSRFAAWSSPARESPAAIFVERSKSAEVKPDSMSLENDEGKRW